MADLISNPNIPYHGSIVGGLFPGKTIYFQGFIPKESDRFTVDLQAGGDTAFHFNPRFKSGKTVVCNSTKNNKWANEERCSNPFQLGSNFELIILCELNCFKVAVNGKHLLAFNHRMKDLHAIQTIGVAGSVKLYSLRFEPPSAAPPAYPAPVQPGYPAPVQPGYPAPVQPGYPAPAQPGYPAAAQPVFPPAGFPPAGFPPAGFPAAGFPAAGFPAAGFQPAVQPVYPPAVQPVYPPQPIINPPIPYCGSIPGGIRDGKIITVKGVIKPSPTRFHVNFQSGFSTSPPSDIIFHFNPRFNEKAIVMNTRSSSNWGPEEKHSSYFPFFPNGSYEMMFLCTGTSFKVALNGSHLVEYKHRLSFQNITTLVIGGDIFVSQISFN